jgi:UDP-GlcNAc:undecaprenyl-phosphate/decaprenyl-phosphate GlcNAc-1-phosphate transferase
MRNVDENIERWGSRSKPAFGGISFFINFLFSISLYFMFNSNHSLFENLNFIGLVLACTLGFLIGLADDAYNTRPILKFSAQLACALILIFSGTYIKLFDNLFINYIITVFWIVGIMNSINMLDNMDAITSTVSAFIIISALIVLTSLQQFQTIQFFILIGVLGAIIGFLRYNWNPSKMYMGDTGSQFLGVLLSAIGIFCFWNAPFETSYFSPVKNLILTAIIFIVPIIDTTTVVINRISSGKSPFVGGRDHTTHHLSYLGFKDHQVAIILGFISFLSCLITIYVVATPNWSSMHTYGFMGYFIFFLGLLFYTTKIKKK